MKDRPSAFFLLSEEIKRQDILYSAHLVCSSVSRGCIPWGVGLCYAKYKFFAILNLNCVDPIAHGFIT